MQECGRGEGRVDVAWSPAARFDVVAAAALAMRIGLAADATATLNAGTRLVRQAASAWEGSLVSLLLRAEVPSLLWRALRDSEAAARMSGAAEQTTIEAAAALEALLRPLKPRLQLARAADACEGGAFGRHVGEPPLPTGGTLPRPPVAFYSLLSAHALARSWLPGVSVGCCPSHSLVAWPRAPRPMQSRTGASSRQVLAQHTTL